MFTQLSVRKRRQSQGRRGWTLLETLMAMMGGTIVLGSILTTGNVVSTSMAAICNYNTLSKCSRNTLDVMCRDLRNTAVVTSLSNSQITLSNSITGDTINYSWDGSNVLTRTFDGAKTVMLTGCDTLFFSGYQRNPLNNMIFLPSSTPAQTKLVSVSWRCSREILGAKINTESIQTAQICIRN